MRRRVEGARATRAAAAHRPARAEEAPEWDALSEERVLTESGPARQWSEVATATAAAGGRGGRPRHSGAAATSMPPRSTLRASDLPSTLHAVEAADWAWCEREDRRQPNAYWLRRLAARASLSATATALLPSTMEKQVQKQREESMSKCSRRLSQTERG